MRSKALTLAMAAMVTLSAATTSVHAADNGLDDAAKARLVGTHKLSLQWIDWGDLDQAGSVVIKDRGDVLTVNGSETKGAQRLDIHGQITAASQDGFVFDGTITMQVDSVAEGSPCTRSGTMHFKTSGKRKYWRLQEMQSPCDVTTDYVDIYFLGI